LRHDESSITAPADSRRQGTSHLLSASSLWVSCRPAYRGISTVAGDVVRARRCVPDIARKA